jgi:hypothetical protein
VRNRPADGGVFIMRDRLNQEVPEGLERAFEEGRRIRRWIATMRSSLQGFRQIRASFGADIGTTTREVLEAIYIILDRLEMSLPYAVCVKCKKSPICACKGLGWLPPYKLHCRSNTRKEISKARDTLLTELTEDTFECLVSDTSTSSTPTPETSIACEPQTLDR